MYVRYKLFSIGIEDIVIFYSEVGTLLLLHIGTHAPVSKLYGILQSYVGKVEVVLYRHV